MNPRLWRIHPFARFWETFAKGAALEDPAGKGNTRRAIDFHQVDPVDEEALKAPVALNLSAARR